MVLKGKKIAGFEASWLLFLKCKISYNSYNLILYDLNNHREVTLYSPHWNVELNASFQNFSAKFLLEIQE